MSTKLLPVNEYTREWNGHTFRSLTIDEVRRLREHKGIESDVLAIAWSGSILPGEAEAWVKSTRAGDVAAVLTLIFQLSGLDEGAEFPGRADDDAVNAGGAIPGGRLRVLPGDEAGEDVVGDPGPAV